MSLKIKFAFKKLNIYVCSMQSEILTPVKSPDTFVSVKQYADQKGTTVQAVYGKITRNTVEVKRIGNLILVKDI